MLLLLVCDTSRMFINDLILFSYLILTLYSQFVFFFVGQTNNGNKAIGTKENKKGPKKKSKY